MSSLSLSGKKVLITGAAGFIGSHVAERAVELGADTTAFVHYNSRNTWGFIDSFPAARKKNIEVVLGDIRDADAVRKASKGKDIILHLAALIGIPYSFVNPRDVVDTNVGGTLNILTAALESGADRIVVTSTSEVFGTAQYVPIDELHPLKPHSPYAATKIAADKLAESFYATYGLPVVVLRPFNTYGPRQSMRAVIPSIINQLLTGTTVKIGNVKPTRDLTFVSDTVEGFMRAATLPKVEGESVNLGVGSEISVGELIKTIARLMKKEYRLHIDKARTRSESSEVDRLLSNNLKAKKILQWRPMVSLEDGLIQTIDWMKQNLPDYKIDSYTI